MRLLLRRLLSMPALCIAPLAFGSSPSEREGEPRGAPASCLSMPLDFIENQGQFDESVRFQARLPRANVLVHTDGWSLAGSSPVRVRFETGGQGSSRGSVRGLEPTDARATYIRGAASTSTVPAPAVSTIGAGIFQRVRWEKIRPGLDLELYERQGRLEYDLFLAAGAPAERIAFTLEGVDASHIDEHGNLVALAGGHRLLQQKPVAHELDETGVRHGIPSRFRALGNHSYGFELDGRNAERPVVIDPVLLFSEFVGGSSADVATDIVIDAEGSMYVTGWSRSDDFAGTEHQARGRDVVIFKLAPRAATGSVGTDSFSPGGMQLVFATFLTGARDDEGTAIAVNGAGEVFVTGKTRSNDFPTTGRVLQGQRAGGTDTFATRLSADGRSLTWSTYLGGSSEDIAHAVALGPNDSILIAGSTRSRDFPSSSFALQAEWKGGSDAFVLRLDAGGQYLLSSTYLGGIRDDEAFGLGVDGNGNTYVTGRTDSPDFPTTTGAFDLHRSSSEAFVVKLGRVGDTLIYSTFLGGGGQEAGYALVLDRKERVWVAGWTRSDDFPTTPNAMQPRLAGRGDGFVACMSPSGSRLEYSTYLGGSGKDEAFGIALDTFDCAWITGRTESDDFPTTPDAFRAQHRGAGDAFLIGLQEGSGRLNYGTYLGWSGDETGTALGVQPGTESVVVVGHAEGIAADLRGPLSGRRSGLRDAFVARFEPGLCTQPAALRELGAGVPLQLSITRPRLGKPLELTVSGGPPNVQGLLLFSSGDPLPTVLEEIATLQIDPAGLGVLMRFSTDQEGNWRFLGRLPNDARLCGAKLVLQAVTLHRANSPLNFGQISQGYALTFGN